MSDINSIDQDFATIVERIKIGNGDDERRRLRAIRRALAVNAVLEARVHGGIEGPVSQRDADVMMAMTELLDRVAEG